MTAPYDADYVSTSIFRHAKALYVVVPKNTELCYVLDNDCVFVRVKNQYIAALDQLLEVDLYVLWERTADVEPIDYKSWRAINKIVEYKIQLDSARSPKIAEIYNEVVEQQAHHPGRIVPNTRIVGVCLVEYLKRHLLLEQAVLSY